MAFPVILVNATGGSDTAASGAGPTTALSGTTNASFSAGTVTLPAGTDLTNVAVDGSHVLYLLTSTGVRFFKITAKAGSGGATPTVDVTPSPTGTTTSRTWAIGGKRASIGSTSSIMLFDNAGAAGDAMPGWTVQLESGHTETLTDRLVTRRAGDVTSGPITLRGALAAATMPILTWNTNDIMIFAASEYVVLKDFEQRNTNATKTASEGIRASGGSGFIRMDGIRNDHATNKSWIAVNITGAIGSIENCRLGNTASKCIRYNAGGSVSCRFRNNYIHDTGDIGFDFTHAAELALSADFFGNVFQNCANQAVRIKGSTSAGARMRFAHNDFISNSGDGILFVGAGDGHNALLIENNIFKGNGDAIEFDTLTAVQADAMGVLIRNNAFNGNTNKYLPSGLTSVDEQTTDPTFTDTSTGDFSVGTNMKALGAPTGFIGQTITRSYVDIGAAQRQESGGGGTVIVIEDE